MPRFTDTIAALATPAGTSAIAVVRISGPDTRQVARAIFGEIPPPRSMRHADYRDRSGLLLDDVLWVFFQAPRSYTGEDSLEISCHGNPFIAQKILEDLLARGCRVAMPGEFTQRAFLNGRMDLSQAEAVMDVIAARSERALSAANRQLRGALGRRTSAAIEQLLAATAQVEAYIDFPEEDLPPEDSARLRSSLTTLLEDTRKILATSHYGEMLRNGIKTVIAGRPNAGKSSLLNRLVGRERALVSPEPGTTRDYIEEPIMVGPHCLRLIDTAGLNLSPAPLEKLGIDKTHEQIAEADLILAVVDASDVIDHESLESGFADLPRSKTILVFNKCDLVHKELVRSYFKDWASVVQVSAQTGQGLDRLREEIIALGDRFQIDVGEDQVAINARHAAALQDVVHALEAARAKLEHGAPTELIASDLRDALRGFEQISGRIDNERMLDQLFASFCIGK